MNIISIIHGYWLSFWAGWTTGVLLGLMTAAGTFLCKYSAYDIAQMSVASWLGCMLLWPGLWTLAIAYQVAYDLCFPPKPYRRY